MTLVNLFYERNSNLLVCMADSLASETNNPLNHFSKQALKFQYVQFKMQNAYLYREHNINVIPNQIGLAYAGNMSIALQVISLVRIICENLIPTKFAHNIGCPSVEAVAVTTKQVLEYYYKSYGALILNSADTEFLVFGYCFKLNSFDAYHLKTSVINNSAEVSIKKIDICNISNYSIGSGADKYNDFVKKSNEKNQSVLFRSFLQNKNIKPENVGGYVQKVTVNSGGFFTYYADSISGDMTLFGNQFSGFTFKNCFLDEYMISFMMYPFI